MVIVYDVTDKESFENVLNWIGEINKLKKKNHFKILIKIWSRKCKSDFSWK